MNEPRLCLYGASPDTGNLGVSALCYSMLAGITRQSPLAKVTVFDEGWVIRRSSYELPDRTIRYQSCGARLSRRYYRPESLWNMRVCGWFGGLGNPGARALGEADAVLDISGGDSFTDLYGSRRFQAMILFKRMVLERKVPLVLLPQTYGPYRHPANRRQAERVVRQSAAAWARDRRSFDVLQELLGSDFDANRHRCGVDVAFTLEAKHPTVSLPPTIGQWIEHRERPLIGLNVSGLIYNDPESAVSRYRLKADYREVILGFVRRLLRESDCNVLLVPHVLAERGLVESDLDACDAVLGALGPGGAKRVAVLPGFRDPGEIKWLIARTDWFCGTRMHATIAALSSGVPTAALAYSDKTGGVFESCGVGDQVVDPREFDTSDSLHILWDAWQHRKTVAAKLADYLPGVLRQADEQMKQIVVDCGARTPAMEPAA